MTEKRKLDVRVDSIEAFFQDVLGLKERDHKMFLAIHRGFGL